VINTYSYIATPHAKLHQFVIAFFNRIEFETGDYFTTFYEADFYTHLVSRHKSILEKAFKNIYAKTKTWRQSKRTNFCNGIRNSNDIKAICEGTIKPWKEDNIPAEIREVTKKLFIKLYNDVLKGDFFKPVYGDRKSHFVAFKKHANNDYVYCPCCGIEEMRTYVDKITDQYDHYLPKDEYPFSSVNFENLVPTCTTCNSIEVKSSKDILSYTGKVFFPYDSAHRGIYIEHKIAKNNVDISEIEWTTSYTNKNGKNDEISAWKEIYNIVDRHKTHVKGRIEKWYGNYDEYMKDKDSISEIPDIKLRSKSYIRSLKNKKTLECLSITEIADKFDLKVRIEAESYSRFN
jgi:hypothetical protein